MDNQQQSNNANSNKPKRFGRLFLRFRQQGNVLFELTRKNVKTQYRGSILGMFWTLLNPLLNMAVMWVVFSGFFGKDDPAYPIYLLTGNILFTSLRASTDGALVSVVGNRGLLLRTKISPHLFPIASVMTALASFSFAFLALLMIMLGMQMSMGLSLFGVQILWVFAMLPALLMFEAGIGMALSSIFVYGRDIKHFYSVFLLLWMYLTPIFYKIKILGEESFASKVVECNPMYYFVQYFRDAVYYVSYTGESIQAFPTILQDIPPLAWLYIMGFASCLFGAGLFALLKRRFATHL